MKKTIALILLYTFILSGTELHQLLKIPELVEHYIDHQKADEGISFMEFLNMHYVADNDVKDNQHDNLPFKSHCTMANHIIVAEVHFFPEQNYFNLSFFELGLVKYKEVFYSSRMAESIWQPPKLS